MQSKSVFRRARLGHVSSSVSRFSSAAAGLRLQGLLPGDDLGRDLPELPGGGDIMDSKKLRQLSGAEPTGPAIRVSRLTETNLAIADPGENVLSKPVISREGKECGIVADLVITVEPQQVLFIEVLLTGQRSPGPVRVLVPVEAIRQVTGERVYIEQPADRVRRAPACNLAEAFEVWRERLYGHFGYPSFHLSAHGNGRREQYGETPYWSASPRYSPHLCPPDEHHF
jgi:hypothetical protein